MIGFEKLIEMPETKNCATTVFSSGTITSLSDERIKLIDPTKSDFFDDVLNFKTSNRRIQKFIDAIKIVEAQNLPAFYKPVCDPSIVDKQIAYLPGKQPAIGKSYNWWVEKVESMPEVEGKKWKIATECMHYAFLVHLINEMVKNGKTINDALYDVVVNSKHLGHYCDSENRIRGKGFELTCSRCVCDFYDLANTSKLLACSNEKVGGFWIAGGHYNCCGSCLPLADINHHTGTIHDLSYGVAIFVL